MPHIHKFTESEQVYVSKAEQYCATNEQCRSAVRDKLRTWGADKDLTERIVEHLVDNDFINEERYCRIYCDSKINLQKWGRIKIAYQLRSKRIDNKTIDLALKNIDEQVYLDTLQNLAETKANSINENDPHKRKTKLTNFLSSHGFTATEIENALAKIGNDNTQD